MGASAIEVGGIGLQHPEELVLVEDEQVIEALAAHTSQKALTEGIDAWSVIGCPQELDAGPARYSCKERAKLAVIVTDQEPGRLPEGCRFP